MPHWQLDRFVVKAEASATYELTELDGATPKTLYTGSDGQIAAASNTITTDHNGTAYAYFRGDAQLRRGGALVRDRIRQGWEFLEPTTPAYGGAYVRAIMLLTPEEQAQVWDATTFPTIDLAPKIQAWLDGAMNLYGDGLTGNGGRGCKIEFDAGQWLISHLDIRPGQQLIGLSSRDEVQFIQEPDYNSDDFITLLGHLSNSDVVQRRTETLLIDISFEANGLLDSGGETLDCIHVEPEIFSGDGTEDSATRTGVICHRISCVGASGYGFKGGKRGKNWVHMSQFRRNGTADDPDHSGGLYMHGPDSRAEKAYCGSNYGHQLHIFSSATPMVYDVELGATRSTPMQYFSLYSEGNVTLLVHGGNCESPMMIEGLEDDNTSEDYDFDSSVIISNVGFLFKERSFIDFETDAVVALAGYIKLKDIRGVVVQNCKFRPPHADVGTAPVTHHYTYRPTKVIDIAGTRTTAVFNCPLPPLTDQMFPAGSPETYAGPVTNSYDDITDKSDQVLRMTQDMTDTSHAWMVDRLKFFNTSSGIVGATSSGGKAAGLVGEVITSVVESGSPVSLTTATVANLTSLALTTGHWSIYGTVQFIGSGATVTNIEAASSTANNDVPSTTAEKYAAEAPGLTTYTGNISSLKVGPFYARLTSDGTRYLNAKATFSAGTMTMCGYFEARRVD